MFFCKEHGDYGFNDRIHEEFVQLLACTLRKSSRKSKFYAYYWKHTHTKISQIWSLSRYYFIYYFTFFFNFQHNPKQMIIYLFSVNSQINPENIKYCVSLCIVQRLLQWFERDKRHLLVNTAIPLGESSTQLTAILRCWRCITTGCNYSVNPNLNWSIISQGCNPRVTFPFPGKVNHLFDS